MSSPTRIPKWEDMRSVTFPNSWLTFGHVKAREQRLNSSDLGKKQTWVTALTPSLPVAVCKLLTVFSFVKCREQ